MGEYYHNLVTEKSWQLLKDLRRSHKFILIGGWAVFLWTQNLKSKDIDIVVDYPELEKLRQKFELSKNERLKKYEVKQGEVDIDIYAYHYSDPGLPAEEIAKYVVMKEGFDVPRPEVLLVLKQRAFQERQGTPKGEKDRIDIISLLLLPNFDFGFYKEILRGSRKQELLSELNKLLSDTLEVKELDLNRHKFGRIKKLIIEQLS